MIRWVALPAAALLGCAAAAAAMQPGQGPEEQLAKALDGLAAGKPQECISNMATQGPEIIDNKTLLYRQGRTVWRNDVIGPCNALEPGNTLIVEINGGQLCHNDRFRVIEPGASIPSMPCRLGKFTPYK